METIHSREYVPAIDLPRIRTLVQRRGNRPFIMDLDEKLAIREIAQSCTVWVDSVGCVAAVAFVDDYQNLWFDSTPDVDLNALIPEILLNALNFASQQFGEYALDACEYSDSPRLKILMENGFTQTGLRTFRYELDPPIASSSGRLPAGFFIRPVKGESEIPDLVALHRAAFGSGQMTDEYRTVMMRTPGYNPELDLVLVSPDDRLAAFCICSLEPQPDGSLIGYPDPIGVHPDFQGLQLGKSMLGYCVQQLKDSGARKIELGTSSENQAMQALAESVGFRVAEEKVWLRYESLK